MCVCVCICVHLCVRRVYIPGVARVWFSGVCCCYIVVPLEVTFPRNFSRYTGIGPTAFFKIQMGILALLVCLASVRAQRRRTCRTLAAHQWWRIEPPDEQEQKKRFARPECRAPFRERTDFYPTRPAEEIPRPAISKRDAPIRPIEELPRPSWLKRHPDPPGRRVTPNRPVGDLPRTAQSKIYPAPLRPI